MTVPPVGSILSSQYPGSGIGTGDLAYYEVREVWLQPVNGSLILLDWLNAYDGLRPLGWVLALHVGGYYHLLTPDEEAAWRMT